MQDKQDHKRRLPLRRQADLAVGQALLARMECRARTLFCAGCGLFVHPPIEREWILFLCYHWVLDDEREAFRRQLKFLRRYGDFISLDDAVAALKSPNGIGGRYFCVTFDDGFKNFFTNAVPVLKEMDVPAAFFLPTEYIGLDLDAHWEQIEPFYKRSYVDNERQFEFLDWDECRQMAAAGFTLGSHTHSHRRLTDLQPAEAELELSLSKQIIESQLGRPCRHFCCPWGKPNKDFDPALHPDMARRLGYVSFLTTKLGWNLPGDSAFGIARISSNPENNPLVLRYSLFPSWPRLLRAHSAFWARLTMIPQSITSVAKLSE